MLKLRRKHMKGDFHVRFRENAGVKLPCVTRLCKPRLANISVYLRVDFTTLIKERYAAFVDLCRSHKVDKIYAFGSSITDHFDPKTSDIDVVVKLDIDDPADRGEALLSLWDKLEVLFQRRVDLLTEDSIRNPYLKSNINRTKKLIYDREGEKVFV